MSFHDFIIKEVENDLKESGVEKGKIKKLAELLWKRKMFRKWTPVIKLEFIKKYRKQFRDLFNK
ncbi:MAG: hypothetical protein WC389_20960 [Lutibacter sp.]|jgi:hypothetical protein